MVPIYRHRLMGQIDASAYITFVAREWQVNVKCSPFPDFAFNSDAPTVLVDYAFDD